MSIQPSVILAIDAARARLFRIEGVSPRGYANLVEVTALTRPEARLPESQRHSDSSPRSAIGGRGYQTFDDHRGDHELEERRRFAKMIALALFDIAPARSHAVVCVTHSMQAPMSEALARFCPKAITAWYPHECSLLTPHELSVLLTEQDLLPRQQVLAQDLGHRGRTP